MVALGRFYPSRFTCIWGTASTAHFATSSFHPKKKLSLLFSETSDVKQVIANLLKKSLRGSNLTSEFTSSQVCSELSTPIFDIRRTEAGFNNTPHTYCTIISILVSAERYECAQEALKTIALQQPPDCMRMVA
ncbi:hypothetical protein SUGI_0394660 [Cryptomeria japonica]|nr:hypothetical protein SUGI_0394660 [Cryptomeria japonica]